MRYTSLLFLVLLVSMSFAQEACVGNEYSKSSLLASIDAPAKVAIINFFVNDASEANIQNAPILVYMKDDYGNERPIEKIYTDTNGEARFNLKEDKCLNYYFVYCPHDDPFSPGVFAKCTEALVGQSIEGPTSGPINVPLAPAEAQDPIYVLQSVAQLSYCPPPKPVIPEFCLPLFAIFAFLGAALFMSGQNPLRAFDLTTPKMKPLGTRYMARGRGMNLAPVDWANSAVASSFQGVGEASKVATSGSTGFKEGMRNIGGVWGGNIKSDWKSAVKRVSEIKEINKVNMGKSELRKRTFLKADGKAKTKDELEADRKMGPGMASAIFSGLAGQSRYASLVFGAQQLGSKISDVRTESDYAKAAPKKVSVAGKDYELRFNDGKVEAREIGAKDASWKSIDSNKGLLAAFSSLSGLSVNVGSMIPIFSAGGRTFNILIVNSAGGQEEVLIKEGDKWVSLGQSKSAGLGDRSAIVVQVANLKSNTMVLQANALAKDAQDATAKGLKRNEEKLGKVTEYMEQKDEVKRLEKEGGSKSEIKQARAELEKIRTSLVSEYDVGMVYVDSQGNILRERGTGRILSPDDAIPDLKARLKLNEDDSNAVRRAFVYDSADASNAYDAVIGASGGTTQSMQYRGKEGQQLQYTGQEISEVPGLQAALLTIDDPSLDRGGNIMFKRAQTINQTVADLQAVATSYSIISTKMNDLADAYAEVSKDKAKAEKLEAGMIMVSNLVSKMITPVELETKPGEKITVQATNGAEVLLGYYAAQVRDGNVEPPKELMSQYVKIDGSKAVLGSDAVDVPVLYVDPATRLITTGFFNPAEVGKRDVYVAQEVASALPKEVIKPEVVSVCLPAIPADQKAGFQPQGPNDVGPSVHVEVLQRNQLDAIGNHYAAFASAYDVATALPKAQRQQFVEATTGEVVQRAVQNNDMAVVSAYNFYLKRTEEAIASESKQLPETPMLLRPENTFVKVADPVTIEKLFLRKTDSIPVVYSTDPNNPDDSRLGEYSMGRKLEKGESLYIPAELARRAGIKSDATLKTGPLANIKMNLDDGVRVTQRLYQAAEYYTEGAKFFDSMTPVGVPKLGVDLEKPVSQQVKERMIKESAIDPFLARSDADIQLATKRFGEYGLQVDYAQGKKISFDRVKDPRKKS